MPQESKAAHELFEYALRVLNMRPYTEFALRQKLARRGSAEAVAQVIERLKALGFLDDRKYAEGYARLYRGKWGAAKIRRSLETKGVPRDVVGEVLAALEPESDPLAEALALLGRYKSRHKGDKAKAIRFLANRGFSFAVALEAWARYETGES
ncbi:regulatory protein RecX [Calidithermus roseus]|uniref:Regulatory protein RecX n=1 Tax=Calidithermus roseus TaxID=1644118 RepID=A0A399F1M9_9DEIN|nr:regulatory protein RecX [Calidithermus roseus]RIH89900.1 Regulatory protein RecX [Calidithermus roseus]